MRRSLCFLALIGFFTSAYAAASSSSQALKAIESTKGEAILKSLVELTGDGGTPQPHQWKALFNDPTARGGVREVVVENGEVSSERTPLRGFAGVGDMPVINASGIPVDSLKAFRIAEQEAVEKQVAFHSVDYTLRMSNGAVPVWILRLHDKMGAIVGNLEISASTGDVVKSLTIDTDYVKPEVTSSSYEDSTLRQRWSEDGGLVGKVEDVSKRTGNTIKRTTLRVGGAIQEFFTGERTIDDDNN